MLGDANKLSAAIPINVTNKTTSLAQVLASELYVQLLSTLERDFGDLYQTLEFNGECEVSEDKSLFSQRLRRSSDQASKELFIGGLLGSRRLKSSRTATWSLPYSLSLTIKVIGGVWSISIWKRTLTCEEDSF